MVAPLDPGRPVADARGVRRAPRWLVEATAWALGLVLLVALGATQAIEEPREVVEAATPAMREPLREQIVPPAPTPVPKPTPKPKAPVRAAAQPDLDVESVLGPPPGPQHDPRPARTAAPADRYAFLVGVQDYRRPTVDTIGSRKDVQYIRSMLLGAGWKAENIRMVVDGQATGRAIRDGIGWLASTSRPGQTFSLFHYSGHVKQHGGVSDSLWPVDRDFVRDTQVADLLSRVQGRMWVDIAGCEGASFLDGVPSSRVLFSGSSKAVEKSYEYPAWGMSVWTGLVFDLSLRQGQADADKDGRTTLGEALRYSQYYAQAITLGQRPHGRQTPQFTGAPDLGWTLADPPA
ncbi:MAG: peptidase caspase catalytic subunit p20 [Frankiales bacterium]|nr:peptidase caspase catalytic subunit p20 [Frankiales bacterium]